MSVPENRMSNYLAKLGKDHHLLGDKPGETVPATLPEYDPISRKDILTSLLSSHVKTLQNVLLQPFVKWASSEKITDKEKFYVSACLILLPTLTPLIAFAGAVMGALAHALFYTAIGKVPDGHIFTYGDL